MYKTDMKLMMILYYYIIKWYYILQLSLHGCPLVIIKWYVYNTDTEDVKDEILIDSAPRSIWYLIGRPQNFGWTSSQNIFYS